MNAFKRARLLLPQFRSCGLHYIPDGIGRVSNGWRKSLNLLFEYLDLAHLFDLPLLAPHHNIRPFGVNALNGELIIRYRYPSSLFRTGWKRSNETCDRN